MPEINREIVEKIARLANLKITAAESVRLAGELEHILEYINQLNQLDTEGIPQTAHPLPMQNIWREDTIIPGLTCAEALAEAPDTQDCCFRVPRIIE